MPLRNFSANLRAAMGEAGLTQVELAQQTGCTQSDISRYLSTNRVPNGEKLVELALALGTTAERLVTGRELAVNAAPEEERAGRGGGRVNPEISRLAKQAAEAVGALQEALRKLR